jgi:endonuclease/exonuclease/phosphatase family metal-dependent hydrolase
VNLVVRRLRAGRSLGAAAPLVAAVGCVLALALTGSSQPAGSTVIVGADAGRSSYTLMQMNLCLSGLADCYGRAAYPAVVREAVAEVRRVQPDAVTFNEVCRGDVARIARRTGYHLRFSRVIYLGAPLRCIDPGGRGLFGDAVLAKAAIVGSEARDFRTQSDIERRRWLCATTRLDVDVCTAHLSTRSPGLNAATNDAQCAELGALLARRSAARTVVFGGDVNRRGSCAPDGVWTVTDASAEQAPGIQHVYGSRDVLPSPRAEIRPSRHSDHDVLVVRARRVPDTAPAATRGDLSRARLTHCDPR